MGAGWDRLGPNGRVVVMDMGLAQSRWHRLLDPIARLLVKLGPGDAYSDPWSDLAAYGPGRDRALSGGLLLRQFSRQDRVTLSR